MNKVEVILWSQLFSTVSCWEKQVEAVGSQMNLGEAKGRSYTSSPTCMGKDHKYNSKCAFILKDNHLLQCPFVAQTLNIRHTSESTAQ